MKNRFGYCIPLLLLAALTPGCSHQDSSSKPDAPASENASEPAFCVRHGTNGEVLVTVKDAIQNLIGLQIVSLEPARLKPEVKGHGRVLDIGPLAALTAELTTAEAVNAVSQAELRRVQTLSAQHNASERVLQAAEAAAIRDNAQVESARLRLVAGWGGAIAERKDLAGFVRALGSLSNVLVQVDLPAGEPLRGMPTEARLVAMGSDIAPVQAQFVGPATAVDAQTQRRGFLFLVCSNQGRLFPGTAVTGFLSLPGEEQSGVVVPRDALVRFNGATWVYVQRGEEEFERLPVTLEQPLEKGWFVSAGLDSKWRVVQTGAQELLSEELKGGGDTE